MIVLKSLSLLFSVKGYVDGKRFVPVAIEKENKIHRNMDNRHEQCHREGSCVARAIVIQLLDSSGKDISKYLMAL